MKRKSKLARSPREIKVRSPHPVFESTEIISFEDTSQIFDFE